MTPYPFVKGHGTENDFVLLPDHDGAVHGSLSRDRVVALCDRHAGIGGDGVIRVIRTSALRALEPGLGDQAAEWFMDYRNADGSVSEMCGNGVRVFARYLVEAGLAAPGDLRIATRGGVRTARLGATGDVTVDMGAPEILGRSRATVSGRVYEGLGVSMGNPHLACAITEPLSGLDLTRAPEVDAAFFPEGVNVELFRPEGRGRVEMRVHERGSGETRSCGTGAVATAVAAAHAEGRTEGTWEVAVLGGVVTVTLTGETSFLSGPAVLVAEGELHLG
jgi:diaminopimelate epimerase